MGGLAGIRCVAVVNSGSAASHFSSSKYKMPSAALGCHDKSGLAVNCVAA